MTELNHDMTGELNDADLEQVAGGAKRIAKSPAPARRSGGDLRTAKAPARSGADLRTVRGVSSAPTTRVGANRDLKSAASKPVRVAKPIKKPAKATRISKY